jgi:ABC-type glutathione transport system ATPase component
MVVPLIAVDGVSFDVRHGEIFGLLGPNGAGKTTTLEILEGLKEPTSGRTFVLGLDSQSDRCAGVAETGPPARAVPRANHDQFQDHTQRHSTKGSDMRNETKDESVERKAEGRAEEPAWWLTVLPIALCLGVGVIVFLVSLVF